MPRLLRTISCFAFLVCVLGGSKAYAECCTGLAVEPRADINIRPATDGFRLAAAIPVEIRTKATARVEVRTVVLLGGPIGTAQLKTIARLQPTKLTATTTYRTVHLRPTLAQRRRITRDAAAQHRRPVLAVQVVDIDPATRLSTHAREFVLPLP